MPRPGVRSPSSPPTISKTSQLFHCEVFFICLRYAYASFFYVILTSFIRIPVTLSIVSALSLCAIHKSNRFISYFDVLFVYLFGSSILKFAAASSIVRDNHSVLLINASGSMAAATFQGRSPVISTPPSLSPSTPHGRRPTRSSQRLAWSRVLPGAIRWVTGRRPRALRLLDRKSSWKNRAGHHVNPSLVGREVAHV